VKHRKALAATLLVLALIVAAFAATWLTLPTDSSSRVSAPASWFASGITSAQHVAACDHPKNGCFDDGTLYTPALAKRRGDETVSQSCGIYGGLGGYATRGGLAACTHPAYTNYTVDTASLKRRVKTVYGAAAVIVVLLGAAFIVLGRRPQLT
jgi:hypothetical protein